MMCPKCEARGYVDHTVQKDDCTWRYYHCPKCFHRWRTVERIEKARMTNENIDSIGDFPKHRKR